MGSMRNETGYDQIVWFQLRDSYRRYGNGPEFWDAYQRILEREAFYSPCRVDTANLLANMAVELGATCEAEHVCG